MKDNVEHPSTHSMSQFDQIKLTKLTSKGG